MHTSPNKADFFALAWWAVLLVVCLWLDSLTLLSCSQRFPSSQIKTRGQRATLPASHSRFFFFPPSLPLPIPSLSPFLAILIVGRHGNKSTQKGRGGGASIIEAAVGLVVSRELDIVKWSDSCTHKQRVRWSRRAEGWWWWGGKRRIERGPKGEGREEPTPRVFWPASNRQHVLPPLRHGLPASPGCLRHTAVESHSSWKTTEWAHGNATCCWGEWEGGGKKGKSTGRIMQRPRQWCVNCHLFCITYGELSNVTLWGKTHQCTIFVLTWILISSWEKNLRGQVKTTTLTRQKTCFLNLLD